MKTYTKILLSSLFIMGFAANAQAQDPMMQKFGSAPSLRMLSAQTEQASDVRPHRGSGRRDFIQINVFPIAQ